MSAYQPQGDPTAVVGRRVGAFVLDAIVANVVGFAAFFLLADSGPEATSRCDSIPCYQVGDTLYSPAGLSNLLYWVIVVGYSLGIFVVLQGFKGMTPGKAIVGVRTVDERGRAPGPLKAFLRHLLLIVDLLPYCIPGLLGIILMATQTNHQRVGDKVAKTFVVAKRDVGRPIGGAPVAGPPMEGGPVAPGPAMPVAPPAAPAATPPQPAAQAPTPEQGPPSTGTEPQWDPARNAYIQWDPKQQRWLQFDDATQQWRPISQ